MTCGGSLIYTSGLSRSVRAAQSGGERPSPARSQAENTAKYEKKWAWSLDEPFPFGHRSSDRHEICTEDAGSGVPRFINFS